MIVVNDRMQRGYSYLLTEPTGRNFDPGFRPELTPKEMLALGVFCGNYMTDCHKEFPAGWFAHAKLSPRGCDCSLNYFGLADDTADHMAGLVASLAYASRPPYNEYPSLAESAQYCRGDGDGDPNDVLTAGEQFLAMIAEALRWIGGS